MTAMASLGLVAQRIAALVGGRLSDALVARGHDEARLRRWAMVVSHLVLGIAIGGCITP